MKNKKGKIFSIISTIILVLLLSTSVMFEYNLYQLKDIENIIRIVVGILIVIINIVFIVLYYLYFIKKKIKIFRLILVFMCLFFLIISFLNYNFYKIYNILDNITNTTQEYKISLVTFSDNKIEDIRNIDSDIGVISDEEFSNGYKFAKEVVKKNNIKYKLIKYENYSDIVNALYAKEIKYAFLPDNFVQMFSQNEEYENIEKDFKIIHTDVKVEEIVSVSKDSTQPFSILLMGVDTLSQSYNADTLMVITFNPQTLGLTMLSIPRDTYTTIACSGGKHKINSSGWYSDQCVVDTVSNLIGIKIDYYAKVNFTGIVSLVDAIGGIDVNVVYPFCEQNSLRQFGEHMIYVEEGQQHLNGEQALALSRNRNYWYGKCPAQYNSKGYYGNNLRNDITRGLNQQLVIKGIANALTNVKDITTVYSLLDTIGANVNTNMDRDTILSFYNVFKNIMSKSSISAIESAFDIKKLSIEIYDTYINISSVNVYMIIPHQNSINAISNAMKENLGLIEKTPIKNISFNINNPFVETTIGPGIYGGTILNLLPSLVGKSYDEAINYCNSIGYTCNINYREVYEGDVANNVVISQYPLANYDMSLIHSKSITLEVSKAIPFDYTSCKTEGFNNERCVLTDFTNKTISEFNSWYSNFKYLKVNLIPVEDASKSNDTIINQSIVNKNVYELYTNNSSIEIKYVKNKENVSKEEITENDETEVNNSQDNTE